MKSSSLLLDLSETMVQKKHTTWVLTNDENVRRLTLSAAYHCYGDGHNDWIEENANVIWA